MNDTHPAIKRTALGRVERVRPYNCRNAGSPPRGITDPVIANTE